MPIDNDYFKNRQQQKGSNNNSNKNDGGNFQPPFEPPEFFKNFGTVYFIKGVGHLLI